MSDILVHTEAGVTTLLATPVTGDAAEYVDFIEQLQRLVD